MARYLVNAQMQVEADYFEVDDDQNLLFYREGSGSSVRRAGFRRGKGLTAVFAAGGWISVMEAPA